MAQATTSTQHYLVQYTQANGQPASYSVQATGVAHCFVVLEQVRPATGPLAPVAVTAIYTARGVQVW